MRGFDWDNANRAHIARHGVSVAEAEEACASETLDMDQYMVDDEMVDDELRYEDVGSTLGGLILQLVTTERSGLVRVVTAFDAPRTLKEHYLRTMVNFYE